MCCANNRAFRSDVAFRAEWGFDAHANAGAWGKNSLAVSLRLTLEQLPGQHRDNAALDPVCRQHAMSLRLTPRADVLRTRGVGRRGQRNQIGVVEDDYSTEPQPAG